MAVCGFSERAAMAFGFFGGKVKFITLLLVVYMLIEIKLARSLFEAGATFT